MSGEFSRGAEARAVDADRAVSTTASGRAASKRTVSMGRVLRAASRAPQIGVAVSLGVAFCACQALISIDDYRWVEPTERCETNAVRCNEEGLRETCSALGTWAEPVSCPFVCTAGACSGECVPGERDCLLGSTPRRCDEDGLWREEAVCASVCVAGECVGACLPQARQCSASSSLVCNADGLFEAGDACEFVCDSATGACAGECSPNSVRCEGRDLQICGPDARWERLATCPYVCAPDAETPGGSECTGVCTPGATRCDGETQLATCNGAGQWEPPSSCGDQTCGGDPASCQPAPGCEAPLATCDGQCVDVQNDPSHCGRCEHSCLGASCTAGVCAPATLAEGSFNGLEVASPWLYLLEDGVVRLPTSGGTREAILDQYFDELAADDSYLYGTFQVGAERAELWRVPNTGASYLSEYGVLLGEVPFSTVLTVNTSSLIGLRIGAARDIDCNLLRVDKTGATTGSTPLTSFERARCSQLRIDELYAYVIVLEIDTKTDTIVRASLDDGSAFPLWRAESGESIRDIALTGDSIVFASTIRIGSVPTSSILNTSSTIGETPAYRVLTDSDVAYHLASADGSPDCTAGSILSSTPLAGGTSVILAVEPRTGCIRDFVEDDDAIYWLTEAGYPDTIRQLRKVSKR